MSRAVEVSSEEVNGYDWYVLRRGKLNAVTFRDGAVRFRVQIEDVGREPFITQWFNDLTPAEDFLDRVKTENEALVRKHLKLLGVEDTGGNRSDV
jgi:hypothetical protein